MAIKNPKCKKRDSATVVALLIVTLALTAISVGQTTASAVGPSAVPVANAVSPDTATASTSTSTRSPEFKSRNPRYHIEAGDTFDLTFDLSPEFNQLAVAVQPDGYVNLKAVGELKVAGQTVPELTATLREAYGKILNNPMISVVLKEFEKPYFIADGQVAKPGKYEMHGNMTLTQAIAVAGGFQSSAKHSQVVLFRRVDDQWTEATLIDVKKMEKNRDLKEDPFLHSGDMLFVPKNTLSKIDRVIPNMSMGSYLPLTIP
ncbi:MAG: polysaccharide biosynthesis/export family protein [Candidatus Sulfotelmatobacter sp.]